MKCLGIIVPALLAFLPISIATAAAPVEIVAADAIESIIEAQPGLLVVSLSSTDPRCQPCMGANSKFEMLALGTNTARFVQVAWAPWKDIPAPVRSLMARFSLPTAVPIRLAFQDGKLVDKVIGEPAMPPQPRVFPQTGRVEVVEPLDAPRRLEQSRGVVVVMLSSFEPDCAFCMRANPVFEELAGNGAPKGPDVKFVRVMYRPWTSVGADAFAKAIGVGGLPVFVTYKDGEPVRRRDGIATVPELRKLLLDGVN